MFHIFTQYPYADNQDCGEEDTKYTKEFSLAHNGETITYLAPNFNKAISEIYKGGCVSLLEIGCGVGSVVESLLQEGHCVVGLDGFYIYRKYQIGPWGRIPNNLLTCDLSKDFTVCYDSYAKFDVNCPYQFDVIYSTEFMEHLRTEDIDPLLDNIYRHIVPNGLIVMEISHREQPGHRTIWSKQQWIDRFQEHGMMINNEIPNFSSGILRNLSTSHNFIFTAKK